MRRSKELIEDRSERLPPLRLSLGSTDPASDATARRLFETAAIDGWRTNRWGTITRTGSGGRRSSGAMAPSSSGQRSGDAGLRAPLYRLARRGPWGKR